MPRVSESAFWLPLALVTGRDLNKESARNRGDKKPLFSAWVLTDLSPAELCFPSGEWGFSVVMATDG